jgi:Glycine cleavage H-protein
MFPGIDGFHWAFGHVLFLVLFFAVALTIAVTIASAVMKTVDDFRSHKAAMLCWNAQFAELPASNRRCRHELAGRVISRTCDNSFDCRTCENYSHFAVLPASGNARPCGLDFPDDRLYHRGHTWVKTVEDGNVLVGLDSLAECLIGHPDSVRMPAPGDEIDANQTAWRMKKNGTEISVRAPIEGTIVEVGGPGKGWYLKMRPRFGLNDRVALRHLLRGPEVRGWISRELERLQIQLRTPGTAPTLADGGAILPNLMDSIPEADWDAVIADTFLAA